MQTSFHDVNANNASSGLRERVCLPIFEQFGANQHITLQEARAIKELKTDQSRIILTTDKGVTMVVMDRPGLYQQSTRFTRRQGHVQTHFQRPHPKLKNQIKHILKNCKSKGQVYQTTYKRPYHTCVIPVKFYGLPEIH